MVLASMGLAVPEAEVQNNHFAKGSNVEKMERAQFTAWLQIVVRNARAEYLRRLCSNDVAIDDVWQLIDEYSAHFDEDPVVYAAGYSEYVQSFQFTNAALENAFITLHPSRQKLLAQLYVWELKLNEIANIRHCSVQCVYNAKYKALKQLRILLEREGIYHA